MATFDLAIEARGARGNEAVLSSEALAHCGEGVDFYRAMERGFRACGIPVGEDGVVIGLDDADGEGEGSEGVLDKGFGEVGGHFFMELDEAQAGAAVDGGILIESLALDEVGDEFDVYLEEVSGQGDGKGAAVAFGVGFSFAGEVVLFEQFRDGGGRGDFF